MSDHFQISGAVSRRPRRASAAPPGRRRGAWRTATLAASVSLLALATAACGSGGGASGGSEASAPAATSAGTAAGSGTAGDTTGGSGTSSAPPASSAPATSAPPVSSASGTPPGEPGDGGQAVTTASRCTAARLGLSLSAPNPGAGQIYYDLRLINKGPGSCTLRGFPGVSLLAGDGAPIGRPATREGGTLPAVTLAPGAAAHITLHTLNKGIKGSSCWARPSLLQIYPPDSKDAMTLATSQPVVCGDTFTVSAVSAS